MPPVSTVPPLPLRQLRLDAGIPTQRAAAELAGVPQQQLSRWESGTAVPRLDALARLLAAYGARLVVVRK